MASRNENGVLLARYHVVLRDGYLASYRQLAEDDEVPAEGRVWYAYLETAVPSPWWNNQTYVDTLDFLPWTTDLFATYRAAYGQDLADHLPEVFWELPDGRCLGYFAHPGRTSDEQSSQDSRARVLHHTFRVDLAHRFFQHTATQGAEGDPRIL